MATILGISGIILLSETTVQAQKDPDLTAQGIPDVIEYLNTLNFIPSG
jgi:hypothetical protein